ncbi:hypothetical protein F5Y18DRAFT_275383 [Xylariaceae sp. FL1019]|nr:hypothetical protein F5Y18DRAFT_275383 [Xylariaceae sp. FL1019]
MDPPPYGAAEGYDANDIVQPGILVLAGRFIHSESSSSTVLYELDSDVNSLSRRDHKVKLSRHEHRLRADDYNDEARTLSYARHIYDLEWPIAIISSERYAFIGTPVSRRVIGGIGLKKVFQPLLAGFKVMLMRGGEHEVVFECTMKNNKYEWLDSLGGRIAIEDSADDQLKMIITTAQPRKQVDALVAAWMLRAWHDYMLEESGVIRKKLGLYKGEFTDYINRNMKPPYNIQ